MKPRARISASSVWPKGEYHILIEKYQQFSSQGKLQGYSIFAAFFLPQKTDNQVSDRVRALKRNGLLPPDDDQPGTPPIHAAEVVAGANVNGQYPGPVTRVEDAEPLAPIQQKQAVDTEAPPTPRWMMRPNVRGRSVRPWVRHSC